MKIAAVLALLAAGSLCPAQTKPDVQLPPNVRMYEPKEITPDKAPRVAASVHNLVGGNAAVAWDGVAHAFILRGEARDMDMAEALLKRFDVPDPRVELTVYLIRASSSAAAVFIGAPPSPAGNPVPADLRSAIDEMKGTFNYDRYTLWDAILLQPKGSGGEVQGVLTSDAENYIYAVKYDVYGGSPLSEGKTLTLTNFTFSLKMPSTIRPRAPIVAGGGPIESHIQTDITVRPGEKLVLGKIRLLPAASGDLFLVLATKVY